MTKLLWVDDDQQWLDMIKESMTTKELQVETFSDLDAFMLASRDKATDAIVLDLRLGPRNQDGLDLARRIRSVDKDVPLFIVSAFAKDSRYRAKLESLNIPVIQKAEFDPQEFLGKLDRAIQSYRTDFAWQQIQKPLLSEILAVNADLLSLLEHDPRLFYSLDPYKFEEVIAELLTEYGFEIEMTGRSWDGGVDFFAVKRDLLRSLYVVQCKRYRRERRVSVSEVRELYGVKNDFAATKGLLATTAYYSKSARGLEEKHKWELELKDYDELVALLNGRPRKAGMESPKAATPD